MWTSNEFAWPRTFSKAVMYLSPTQIPVGASIRRSESPMPSAIPTFISNNLLRVSGMPRRSSQDPTPLHPRRKSSTASPRSCRSAGPGNGHINLKISKVGALQRPARSATFCVSLGIALTIEDSWGGDITTAAISHLAHSTPPEYLFSSTDFNSYCTVSNAVGAPQRVNGA